MKPLALQIAELLERLVDERVGVRLAELGGAGVTQAEYCLKNLPPHTTARTFSRWCRRGRVPGAVRDGSAWRCSVAAWRAARAKGPERARAQAPVANDVDAMLVASGLRPTRAGGSR